MNFDLEKINIAVEICKDIKEAGATNVMVAGGFVRDMLLNKPINDIDVFYDGEIKNPYKVEESKKKQFNSFVSNSMFDNMAQQLQILDDLAYPDSDWEVTTHKTYKPGVEWPIQLIKCKDFWNHLWTFGADISKIMINDSGLFISHAAISNIQNQVISFDNLESKYAKKIQQKFPEYLYV